MSWQDRDWNQHERGAGGRFIARIFENVENPLGWSIKLFTFRGIVTRAHVFFVLYLITAPLFSINQGAIGIWYTFVGMVALFAIVTLHEFGHCFACRFVGGQADRIVLLPWGGLALCIPPQQWRAHFITVAGGPLVNVVLVPVFGGVLLALGMSDALLFNPFDIGGLAASTGVFQASSTWLAWVKIGAFYLYFVNWVLLAFNVLLPCFPLDGGRLVQALMWRKMGFRRATEVATLIGFFGAGVLLIIGIGLNQVMLAVIAAFCAFSCYAERRQVRSMEEIVGVAGPTVFRPDGEHVVHPARERDRGPTKRELRAKQKAEEDERRLDELLDKIREHGMQSLSKKERATLERLSKEKRGG